MKDNEFENQKLFGFYGSLRKGEYNYARLMEKSEGVQFIRTETIKGFDLHSLGSYPVVLPSANKEQPLVVDIFEITDPMVKRRIDGMEIGAGYDRHIEVINGQNVVIYVGSNEYYGRLSDDRKVPDGDWLKRKQPIKH